MTILRFPHLDVLRLAMTSGVVPAEVSQAPAVAGFGPDGSIWVRPGGRLARTALNDLRRLGVRVVKAADVPLDQPISGWPQLLPVHRDPAAGLPTEKTPVLFDLPEAALPELAGEVLRLGNDRQGFRWITDGSESRALLRVIGPPYYTLLRALEPGDDGEAPRAFVERGPRVWVEVGHAHPFVDRIKPPPGKLLLMRPERHWEFLDETPFREIYEVLEFPLSEAATSWTPTDLNRRLTVPLSLARGGSDEPATLWVLPERGLEQLEDLVRSADNRLVSRLAFAVGHDEAGRAAFVLRVRPSKQAPPVLVLEGQCFRPYLRLPNLFLPTGTRLHPPLRRDAVARLLAADPNRITWLAPRPGHQFAPESLPDDAFRPLDQWVDYLLDQDHQALRAWVQATRFDFEPFICRDDEPDRPRKKVPPAHADQPRQSRSRAERESVETVADAPAESIPERRAKLSRPRQTQEAPAELPVFVIDEAQVRLTKLEDQFLALTSPPDAPERQALWREMAALNAILDRAGDASVCWTHALWEAEPPPADWLRQWAETEGRASGRQPVDPPTFDRLLTDPNPPAASLRAVTAALALAAHADGPAADLLRPRLGQLQHLFERCEPWLPTRLAWLAWVALDLLAQGDVLTLARARDRLLERLHAQGLGPDLDLPAFLRFSGGRASETLRAVRDHLLRLDSLVRTWIPKGRWPGGTHPAVPQTLALTDLIFAYGLARLGDGPESRKRLNAGLTVLGEGDLVSVWLARAFEDRIHEALDGKPGAAPLSADLLEALERMDSFQRYKIDRLREHSDILEPHEKIEPYRHWHGHANDALTRELATLVDLTDRPTLADRLGRLLRQSRPERHQALVLETALQVAPRLGEEFARDLLGRLGPALAALNDLGRQARLLEKGIGVAAHFDQSETVQGLVAQFDRLLGDRPADEAAAALEPLVGQCFRSLRKLGLRDEIGRLLGRMAEAVLGGSTGRSGLLNLAAARTDRSPEAWAKLLKLLLHIASGWSTFGQDDRARPIFDEARSLLLAGTLLPVSQTRLACGTIRALGSAPVEFALPRLEELFRHLDRIHDTLTTSSHYSLSRLDVIESAVLTLISDDFSLDRAGRRWLDDDEFLVRRRIHRDVRAALGREA